MKDSKSTVHVVVLARIHQVAKLRAVERRLTLKEYITTLILEDVERQQKATTAAQEPPEHA